MSFHSLFLFIAHIVCRYRKQWKLISILLRKLKSSTLRISLLYDMLVRLMCQLTVCLSVSYQRSTNLLVFYIYKKGKLRAIEHDVLETFRPFVKKTKLFLNVQVTVEEGEKLIEAGKVDGIFIGFFWITHPDLVKRVLHGKPLDNIPDIPHLQSKNESGDWSVGYTDYPTAVY